MTGNFFPIFVACSLIGTPIAFAQNPTTSAAPAQTTPAQATPAQNPSADTAPKSETTSTAATATSPAVPAPGSVPSASTTTSPGPVSTPVEPTTDPKSAKGTGSSLIPHDLSPYGMFMNADIVVKAVMIGLAFASLVTWTLLLAKALELAAARRRAKLGLDALAAAATLGEAATRVPGQDGLVGRLVAAALDESRRSQGLPADGVKERATALLSRIEARAGREMARGTGLLATIGSTAPFVGLFGTVWGIMNSFIGISKTNTTNLAVVAPGIAEALLATATGLVAAIPAVIIYNFFARGITGYRQVLGDASTETLRLLSRDLDRAMRPAPRQAAE